MTLSAMSARSPHADVSSYAGARSYVAKTPSPYDPRSPSSATPAYPPSSSRASAAPSEISDARTQLHTSLINLAAFWDEKYPFAASPSATALLQSALYHERPQNCDQKYRKWADAIQYCMNNGFKYAENEPQITKLYLNDDWLRYNIEYLWTKSGKHLVSESPTQPDLDWMKR